MRLILAGAAAGAALAWVIWRRNTKTSRDVAAFTARWAQTQGIVIPDQKAFAAKLKELVQGGSSKLQVISDFDRTITSATVNGKRGASCHGIVESTKILSAEYKAATKKLFDTYYPIEISPDLTREQKMPKMFEWYSAAHALMLKEQYTEDLIPSSVADANIALRPGCADMVATVQHAKVPLLLFSAGIGNMLAEVMRVHSGPLAPTTHIISNKMKFDAAGKLVGFEEPLIHMFNKDATQTRGTAFAEEVNGRPNVFLLGDGLGDVTMADGLPSSAVLRVGFLNENVEKLLPQYRPLYDVLVLHDGTFDVVNSMLKLVLNGVE